MWQGTYQPVVRGCVRREVAHPEEVPVQPDEDDVPHIAEDADDGQEAHANLCCRIVHDRRLLQAGTLPEVIKLGAESTEVKRKQQTNIRLVMLRGARLIP